MRAKVVSVLSSQGVVIHQALYCRSMAATGYFEEPQSEESESEFSSKFTTSNSRRVIDNRPYDEVFDVLQGDHPIDDEEEEEINSDVEVQGSPQDTEPHASHYESGEDSVSTPRSSRGTDEARDVSPKFSPDEISGPLGSSTE
ncbi:hypothetical protein FOZ63_028224, partial [Perkinsus olseni]